VFTGLTTFSFWLAIRLQRGEYRPGLFFGLVLGTFGIKMIVFLVAFIWLAGQPWLSPGVFAVTTIVATLGSIVIDGLAFARGQGDASGREGAAA